MLLINSAIGFKASFEAIMPVGRAVRYELEMGQQSGILPPSAQRVYEQSLLESDKVNWGCFEEGGIEFPIVDFPNRLAKPYNHFWASGFGSVMPDR